MPVFVRSALAATALIAALAGCASTAEVAGGPRPADLADCRVGGEPGPREKSAPSSARERRCNPQEDVILWSNRGREESIKLDLKKGD